MKVQWTQAAIEQLLSVHDYIALDSPFYAMRMVDRISGRSGQIGRFPYAGRMVPEYGDEATREVIEVGYRIIYIILSTQIDIVSVRHGSKPLPEDPPTGQ